MKNVIVVGAGISGLAAARALHDAGCAVTVLEKNATVGGRIATQKIESSNGLALFDCGAQNIKSHNTQLEEWASRVLDKQRVFISQPVDLHENNCVIPGSSAANAESKWSCQNGMEALPQALAQGLDVRCNMSVTRIEENEKIISQCENGETLEADFLIISSPSPQTATLLTNSRWTREQQMAARIAQLQSVEYSRCLSVQLYYENCNLEMDWYALLARDRFHPLLWISCENCKGFAEHGTALIAQLGHGVSLDLWENSNDQIAQQTQNWLRELLPELPLATHTSVQRWFHSLPQNPVVFDDVNPPDTRVIVCGDGTARGRVTDAYETGLKAAQRILNLL